MTSSLETQLVVIGAIESRMEWARRRLPVFSGGGEWTGPAHDAYLARIEGHARSLDGALDAIESARRATERVIASGG
jgi:hypothetical protein